MSEEKRKTVSFRILPSTTKTIKSRARMFNMSIGEYIEYIVSKEMSPSNGYNAPLISIIEKTLSLKEDVSMIFNMMEEERDMVYKKREGLNKIEMNNWLTVAVHKLRSPETKSRKLLFELIEEGIHEYSLSDYGISILENAFNARIPIRE